jgi:hypothetical protein
MQQRLLSISRIAAWMVGVGAVVIVWLAYDSLPEMFPLTRIETVPKSMLIALRVSLINLLIIGLIELLSRSLGRVQGFSGDRLIVSILFLTASVKAGIEAAEILLLPYTSPWTLVALITVVIIGLFSAGLAGRELLSLRRFRDMQFTTIETIFVPSRELC